MKKYLTSLLTFVLAVVMIFSFAACSKEDSTATPPVPVVSNILMPEYVEDTSGIKGYWVGTVSFTEEDATITTASIEFIFRENNAIAINQDNEATVFKYLYDGEETFIFQETQADGFKLDGDNLTITLGKGSTVYTLKRKVGSDKNHTGLIGDWAGTMYTEAEDGTVIPLAVEFYFVGDKFVKIESGTNYGAVTKYTFDGARFDFEGSDLVEYEFTGTEFNFVVNGTYAYSLQRV